jgi:hypothetical protein
MARTDKLAEAHERLTRAVEEIVSGEDWQQMLAVAARFHRYSSGGSEIFEACECTGSEEVFSAR